MLLSETSESKYDSASLSNAFANQSGVAADIALLHHEICNTTSNASGHMFFAHFVFRYKHVVYEEGKSSVDNGIVHFGNAMRIRKTGFLFI